MFKNINAPIGWFYSDTFNYWQKTNNKIVVYVSRLIYGYQVQLYFRGQLSFCELEARTNDTSNKGYEKMFELGEQWLQKYSDGNASIIQNDDYHIMNPNGVWLKDSESKDYWI